MDSPTERNMAGIAAAIGQPARATMLAALLSGQWLTATELARAAGVTASTASEHLAALAAAGLVRRRQAGRRRYHALTGPEVAAALEGLERLSHRQVPDGRTPTPSERALRFARTCYDHLAGTLGVLLADTLVNRGLVSPTGSDVTSAGQAWLRELGVEVDSLREHRRRLVTFCLDWSERRDHLAGAVGAGITDALLERRWIVRVAGTRAVRVTLEGRVGLDRLLGIPLERTGGGATSSPFPVP